MAERGSAYALPHAHPLHPDSDGIDPADDLMARDDGHRRVRKLAVDDVQVRAADTAGGDPDSDFAWPGWSSSTSSPRTERNARANWSRPPAPA
jgi:hypothetical protein